MKHKTVRALINLTLETATLHQFTMTLNFNWTEKEPHTAITNQPEESKEKDSYGKVYKESNLK